jgi:acyl-coenzyme A thioesterase PaaI-like protein
MTPDEIKEFLSSRVPFLQTLGLSLEELSPQGARLRIPLQAGYQNHSGSLHAGAQFTAVESCALALGFAALPGQEVTCHSKSVSLHFRKPVRGESLAMAQLHPDTGAGLQERLIAEGKVELQVLVELQDGSGERLAEGTVTLSLRRR